MKPNPSQEAQLLKKCLASYGAQVFMAVSVQILVCWIVNCVLLYVDNNILKEHAPSLFRIKRNQRKWKKLAPLTLLSTYKTTRWHNLEYHILNLKIYYHIYNNLPILNQKKFVWHTKNKDRGTWDWRPCITPE
jgi:hypothetical protein